LDSSAILKLLFAEAESDALFREITDRSTTSVLSRVEVIRAVQRMNPGKVNFAREELAKFLYIPIGEPVIRIAESFVGSPSLRSLDAIHVASALLVQSSIQGLITYDIQMAHSARSQGLNVHAPQ
jgi:hypothetical protein